MSIVSFGQNHAHQIGDHLINRDTLVIVRDRDHAMELFGTRWCFEYPDENLEDKQFMSYFPRGVIDLTEEGQ